MTGEEVQRCKWQRSYIQIDLRWSAYTFSYESEGNDRNNADTAVKTGTG